MSDKPAKIHSVDLLTKEQATIVDDIKRHHDAFHRTYEQQMEHAFICGVRLLQLKDSVPHGNKNGDGFIVIREKFLPTLSKSAAGRYMDFVRLLQPQISHGGDFRNTLQLTQGELAASERKKVLKAVHDLADGKTFTAFYRDLGLVKQREKGGFHPPSEDVLVWLRTNHPALMKSYSSHSSHLSPFPWLQQYQPEIAAAFKKQWKPKPLSAELALQAKRDRFEKMVNTIAASLDDKEYAHMPADLRRHAKDIFLDYYKALSGSLKGARRKGQGK